MFVEHKERFSHSKFKDRLAQALGLWSFAELCQTRTMRFPPFLHTQFLSMMQQTEHNYRELFHIYTFDVRNRLQLEATFQGDVYDPRTDTVASVDWDIQDQVYYALDAHTHPYVSLEDLNRKHISNHISEELGLFSQQQTFVYENIYFTYFSGDDLRDWKTWSTQILSEVLITHSRLLWLINPYYPKILHKERDSETFYDQETEDITWRFLQNMIHTGASTIDYKFFYHEVDKALLRFCNTRGYLAFTNSDLRSNQLQRLLWSDFLT